MLLEAYAGCPLCEHAARELGVADCQRHSLWHDGLPTTLQWMQCEACHHVFTRHYWTEQGLAEVFKRAHEGQLAGSGQVSPDAKRAKWLPVVERVVALLGGYQAMLSYQPAASWVDVGCGDGALMMTAADFGFEAVGIDAWHETVARLAALGFRAFQGDFMDKRFDKPLDVLSLMDVLEHLPYPRRALAKAHEMLADGGVLVISLPDLGCSTWRQLDALKANPYWYEIEHHHNFSRRRLMALLEESGFEVADFTIPNRYKAQLEVYALRRHLQP